MSLNERRNNIKKYLLVFVPDVIAKLISEYDYFFKFKEGYDIKGHNLGSICLAMLNDGRLISTCHDSSDCTLKVWNLQKPSITSGITITFATSIKCIGVLSDNRIVVGLDRTLKIWNLQTKREDLILYGHHDVVSCVKILSNCSEYQIVSGSQDNTLKIWNYGKYSSQSQAKIVHCEFTLTGHQDTISCVENLNDQRIVSGSFDYKIKIWNIYTKTCDFTIDTSCEILCIAVHLDGRLISGSQYRINIWNPKTGVCDLNIVSNSAIYVRSLVVLPDGQVVSGSIYGGSQIWNQYNGECEFIFNDCNIVTNLIALPDSFRHRLISAHYGGTIKMWE